MSDFRLAISKLASPDQCDLIRSALLALENESTELAEQRSSGQHREKSDSEGFDAEGKSRKTGENGREAELRQRIAELEAENLGMQTSIEELDKQNAESIGGLRCYFLKNSFGLNEEYRSC